MPETPVAIPNTLAAVRDHTRVYKDFTYVYPVISRRSGGLSIGINLNPDKHCNFDCVYCEVDRKTHGKAAGVNLAQMREELTALIHFARDGGLAREPKFDEVPPAFTRTPRDIAFSGDGEPTMLHNFDECVRVVAEVKRAEGLDATKLVLITDAAGLDTASVKRGLEIMDANQGEIWAKLDAGTEDYYRLVNRSNIRFDRILKNIEETGKARLICIQSLFLKIRGAGPPAAEISAYCGHLNRFKAAGCQIREVQAYTVARPTPETWATALSALELEEIATRIRVETGLPLGVYP